LQQQQQQQQCEQQLQQHSQQQQHLLEEGPFGFAAAAVSPLAAVSTGQGISGVSMPMQSSCEDLFMQWQDEGEEAVE
jgi:hypothetical protein